MEAIIGEFDKAAPRPNPFPGLRPFEPDEDHLFFGRERETDELLRRLRTHRFVSVLGSSGSGKSSLVRSGLIPSLYSGFMVKAGSDWRVAILRPGDDPIGNLAKALDHDDVLGGNGELRGAGRVLLETTLRRSDLGLADCARHAHLEEHENLLVVVDQFEELFRFRESRRVHGSRDEAVAFAKLLLGAAAQEEVPVYVVITMRSDFVGDCMEYPGLPEAINRGQYLIPRMTRDELRRAITGPAAVGGGEIAPRLVARLLNEVGDDPDQLPVLQHALMRTWAHWETARRNGKPVDLDHYDAIGTMEEALSRHAEEAFAELPEGTAQRIAERMFKALTDKRKDDRGVRRPTAVREVAAIADVPVDDVIRVVEVFRKPGRSFLMPPAGVELGSDSILDLSHESLMRNWTRLVEWVDEEAQSGKAFRRLCRAARRYRDGQAGLWVDPELALGLKWRAESGSNTAWAARYDPDHEEALRFLDRSKAAHDARIEAAERERQAKLRRARILAGVLGSAALVTLAFGLYAVRAGRIARQAERVATQEAQKSAAVTDFLVGLFEVADPEEAQGATITAQEILDEGARQIDTELAGEPEVQARMLATIGKVYGSLGLYDKARSILERAGETAGTALGPDAAATLEARQRLAAVLREQGHFQEAREIYEDVLERRRGLLGEDDPDTLASLAGLGQAYDSLGLFQQAVESAEAALAGRRRALGEQHPDTLDSMHDLGEALEGLGRYPEAEEQLVAAWQGRRAVLGEEHPDTLASIESLGSLYTTLGRYDEAEKLYTENLENQRRVFGPDHPKTLSAEFQLAYLYEERGNWDQAGRRMTAVLETRRRVLGDEHPATLASLAALAWLRNEEGRVEEALQLAEEAYETSVRVLGENDPSTRLRANNLASVYGDMGRNDRRIELLEKNLAVYTELYGQYHPRVFMTRNNLAVAYGAWGRDEQEIRMYRENVEAVRASIGIENPDGLIILSNLAINADGMGLVDEADALATELLETSRRVLGEDNPITSRARWILGAVRGSQRRFDEEEQLYQESYEGYRRMFGDIHAETLSIRGRIAGFLQGRDRTAEALPIREAILEDTRSLYGEDHPWTIGAYGALAWVHRMLNQPDQALELERSGLESRRRMAMREGAGAHMKNSYASALVGARRELQNPEEALRFALEANELSGYAHRGYVRVLAEAYFKNGRIDDAIRTMERALALVPEDDPGTRNRFEGRLAEYHEANGNPEPKRRMAAASLARQRAEADKPDATPRAKDGYAWSLLLVDPPDLQDPEESLRYALTANEDTNYENAGFVDTLALAYHMSGDRAKAIELQEKALALTPKDNPWGWPNQNARLRIFRGEGTREVDLARVVPGTWSGGFGPIDGRVRFERDGDYLYGRSLVELPWVPSGEIFLRFQAGTGELEFLETDSGWTNPRWGHPADYRFTDQGELILWRLDQWYAVTLTREDGDSG